MAEISPFTVLTANGDYEIRTIPGREHLLTLKGTFDGATVTMTTLNPATNTYTSVDGGSWSAEAEERFIPTGSMIRLTVASVGTTSIAVNLIPTRDK